SSTPPTCAKASRTSSPRTSSPTSPRRSSWRRTPGTTPMMAARTTLSSRRAPGTSMAPTKPASPAARTFPPAWTGGPTAPWCHPSPRAQHADHHQGSQQRTGGSPWWKFELVSKITTLELTSIYASKHINYLSSSGLQNVREINLCIMKPFMSGFDC
ncbi:hypothetical protein E2562_005657, partial [Oryza meyeriana var. granulata]